MEFMHDGQRSSYLAALEREREGYEHQIEKAKVEADEIAKKRYIGRIAQVDAEIARVEGVDEAKEPTGKKPARSRGKKKPEPKPETVPTPEGDGDTDGDGDENEEDA